MHILTTISMFDQNPFPLMPGKLWHSHTHQALPAAGQRPLQLPAGATEVGHSVGFQQDQLQLQRKSNAESQKETFQAQDSI